MNPRDYESQAVQESLLKWSNIGGETENVLISGVSDMKTLSNLKNVLMGLNEQFTSDSPQIVISGEQKANFEKRLLLVENEIEGLMKRNILYTDNNVNGQRVLDYSNILNEKETQIVELEKKINNLEARLQKASSREIQLQNHIAKLYADLKRREQAIISKNQIILAEVAASNELKQNLNRMKRNLDQNRTRIGDLDRLLLEGVNFPDVLSFEVRADMLTRDGAMSRSGTYSSQSSSQKLKTQTISFFRQLERLNNSDGLSEAELERAFENFLIGLEGTKFRETIDERMHRRNLEEDYNRLKEQFAAAVSIFRNEAERVQKEAPSVRLSADPRIYEQLKEHKINVYQSVGNVLELERYSEKVVEVPVQDARTKHLIHLLATQMKSLTTKYPKLLGEIDEKLVEFFQQEIIDLIEVDEVDRLVEIVKIEPRVVKVENVYAYSSQKSRKIEFHLRVLVKALLEQLEKLKAKTGAVLEIDEGVIGMINKEIMGVVDVDDILKVFRVVPKIVEVQKIVEKMVEKIIEVPKVVEVEKVVEKIVEVEKLVEMDKVIHVPINTPEIVVNTVEKIVPCKEVIEKVIEVPKVTQRIVEKTVEVPKIVEIEKLVEKIVERERVVEVKVVQNHIQKQIESVDVIKEKIVPKEVVKEVIKEVPYIVEKVVEKIVEVPKIIEVEKVVQKLVPQIEYRNAKEIVNHVEVEHQIVEKIVEKPIPIIQTVQKIVEVPQIIEKIVEKVISNQVIKQVESIQEREVIRPEIREVERIVEKPIYIKEEKIVQVQKIVNIPVIHEHVKEVPYYIEKPIVQKIENTVVQEVKIKEPVIITKTDIKEIQKIVHVPIKIPEPVKLVEEKVVPIEKIIQRIKEVRVPIEKIIEKMVQVPKVVEVQKIVEKIVVVPRVVQKVVEVPQIVEKIVPKTIIQKQIVEVQKRVEVPVMIEKEVELENTNQVYVQIEKVVEVQKEVLVEVTKYEEKVVTQEVFVDRIVKETIQKPVEIQVIKVAPQVKEVPREVYLESKVPHIVEIQVPVQLVVEKLVPVRETVEKIVSVPQVVEKIVEQKSQEVKFEEIVKYNDKVVVNTEIKEVVKQVPYFQTKIEKVETIKEKIVPIQTKVDDVKIVKEVIEKLVDRSTVVPQIVEVERVQEKIVEVPRIVEIEKIVPQISKVNEYIERIVEKIVEVPIYYEKLVEQERIQEVVVQVKTESEKVKQVEKIVEKQVLLQKFKQVVRDVNRIEKVLEIVDRYEQIPVPVITQSEKLVEVPLILQKIVEKIVVMPQIVEVLKYVHEIVEQETLGVKVQGEVATHEQKLRLLGRNIKGTMDGLLSELRRLKVSNSALKGPIELVEKFLREFEQFHLYPKIVQIPQEKVVNRVIQKEKIVKVPTDSERSIKMELTLSLLVEKLITELKRIKSRNPSLELQLEEDVKLIFFQQLGSGSIVGQELNSKLKSFSDTIYRQFESLGGWSRDHQLMLNSFLQERFMMANLVKNSNLEIQKVRNISRKQEQALGKYTSDMRLLEECLDQLGKEATKNSWGEHGVIREIVGKFSRFRSEGHAPVQLASLGGLQITNERIKSLLREKEEEILRMKDRIIFLEKGGVQGRSGIQDAKMLGALENQVKKLEAENFELKREQSPKLIASYKKEIEELNQRILKLEQEKSELTAEVYNLNNTLRVKESIYQSGKDHFGKTGLTNLEGKSPYNSPDNRKSMDIKMIDSEVRGGLGSSQYQASKVQNYDRSARQSQDSRVSADRSGVRTYSNQPQQFRRVGDSYISEPRVEELTTPRESEHSASSKFEENRPNVHRAGEPTYPQSSQYSQPGSRVTQSYQAGTTSGRVSTSDLGPKSYYTTDIHGNRKYEGPERKE